MTAIAFSMEWYVGGQVDPGLRRLRMAFERGGAEVAKLGRYVFPRVIDELEAQAKAQFSGEGIGPSGSWAQLSPKYAEWKAKRFPGAPLLQRTRALFSGLTDSSASHAKRVVSDTAMSYGTSGLEYAELHQMGTRRMPARPPVDLGDDFGPKLQRAVTAGVREAVRSGSDGLLDFEGDTYTDESGQTFSVMRGSRGGAFFTNGQGGRTYLKRTTSGQTVTRTFGGKR